MAETWIVTPTYNERANIGTLIRTIRTVLPVGEILVVDDSSPDGTGALVETLAVDDVHLHILHRSTKAGLGAAYVAGLQFALAQGAQHIVHLDADGSHPPELIPRMLAGLQAADLIIASRYTSGGSMNIEWHRRLISALGNGYIRLLLGRTVTDWSTGFKAWRAPCLAEALAAQPHASGYAWLMEMSWLAVQSGAKVVEVPLPFRSRTQGRSKFSLRIALEDLRLAWNLHRRTLARKPGM